MRRSWVGEIDGFRAGRQVERRQIVGTLIGAVAAAAVVAGAGLAERPAPTTAPAARKLNPQVLAMGDNTWLKMNPPREPDGRNYSGCCWGDWGTGGRVFYFGGAHFSYQYDDVDVYDLATNTWTRSWKPGPLPKAVDEGGDQKEKRADRGDTLRRAAAAGRLQATHTYQQVCWVPERKVFFYVGWSGNWEFDPVKNRWTCLFLPPLYQTGTKQLVPWTRWAVQTHHCYYARDIKAPVVVTTHTPQGDWLFDGETTAWKSLRRDISSMGGELYSTYVPPLQAQLISNRTGEMFLHKVTRSASSWKKVEGFPEGLKGCEALAYDSANGVVVAVAPNRKRAPLPVWTLDPGTMKWTEMKPTGAVPRGSGLWAPLWYDPDHNAFFFLNRTGQTGCETWVYRYRRLKKVEEE
jgi:hypothetical protein